jgi:hypothetical protein
VFLLPDDNKQTAKIQKLKTINRCAIKNFFENGPGNWAHFGHNADNAISITNRNVRLRTQQNELSLKEEVKTQATAVMTLLKIVKF